LSPIASSPASLKKLASSSCGAGGDDLDLAGFGDRHIDRVLRDRDIGLHGIAVVRDQLAFTVEGEIAGPGKGRLAGRQQDLEIAAPVDGDVVQATGLGRRALLGDPIDAARLDAGSDLNPGRDDRALAGRLRAHPLDVLVQQVLELGPLPLEPDGVHVGDVVRDDLDVQLLG
jgi:hypothetical protein